MKRKEMVDQIQSKLCLPSKAQAKQVLEILENTMVECLLNGSSIPLSFAKIYVQTKKPRYFHTPNHEIYPTRYHKTLKIKPKKSILNQLN